MLNRDICYKCNLTRDHLWSAYFASSWAYGRVVCPNYPGQAAKSSSIRRPPPKYCHYKLEQAVAAGRANA